MPWEIIGNERALAALARALDSPSRPHACLLAGPEGTGKATAGRQLAQALNCSGEEPPCGECAQCRRIAAGIHADVTTVSIEAAEEGPQRKAIGIDQVREVQRLTALNPFEGRTRVAIIDPADEMTPGAQNAFLKTLEEPPPSVVFLLIATRTEKLLPTVLSRCRRVDFVPAKRQEIEEGLLRRGVVGEQARLLAGLARGRPGWALRMAAEPELLERRKSALEQARALPAMPVSERMQLAERLSEEYKRDRGSVPVLLEEWQGWWRDVLLAQAGAGEGIAAVDAAEGVREDASVYSRRAVTAFIEAIGEALQLLAENVQSRLVLEALVLKAPQRRTARAG